MSKIKCYLSQAFAFKNREIKYLSMAISKIYEIQASTTAEVGSQF
jgi:hypothetical protein